MDDRESTQDLNDVNWTTLKLQVHRRWTIWTGKKKDHSRKKGNNILSLIQYKKNLKFANGKKNLKICFSSYNHSGSVLLRPQFKKSLDFQIFLISYFKRI